MDCRLVIKNAGIAGVLAAGVAPAVHAQAAVRWRLASSFPKSLDTIFGAADTFAKKVGELVASRAKDAGIESVVFDRGGNKYHGRVAAIGRAYEAYPDRAAAYLVSQGTVAIANIDTRQLTRQLRTQGAQNGCIVGLAAGEKPTQARIDEALAAAKAALTGEFAAYPIDQSLRDIEATLGANATKLYAMGLRQSVRRSTLDRKSVV